MTVQDAVVATVDVGVDADSAFEIFTDQIDAWYVRNPYTFSDPDRAVAIRFEPRVGGRLIEVYDAATGEGREMARVQAWEPGRRLVFTDERDTSVEVTFERIGPAATRVRLEHRGLARLAQDLAAQLRRYGWALLLTWYHDHLRRGRSDKGATVSKQDGFTLTGLTTYLYYEDAEAAVGWLGRVFGFREKARFYNPDGVLQNAEMLVGDVTLHLDGAGPGYWKSQGTEGPVGQLSIVFVDDVDAHYAHATAAGLAAEPPEDKFYGARVYSVTDPGGNRWSFWQHLSDTVNLPSGWKEIRSA